MSRRRPSVFGSNLVELGGWLACGILIACGGGYWAGLRSIQPEAAAPRASMTTAALPQVAVARLGAFSDMRAAAESWRGMERAYPELQRHPAGIIQNRGRDGRLFYQFEIGAPSLADARMLCAAIEQSNYQCEAEPR